MSFTFDIYQTLALSVVALGVGTFIRKKISFFERFCIPAPVIGGLIFAIISCALYESGVIEFSYDETMRDVCMVFFFTSVGFQADLKTLRTGGKALGLFSQAIAILIIAQNVVAIGMSKVLGISPLVGMCTGSIPLVGGHGTSGAFGPVLENAGFEGATTFCIAAATYGLIAGGLIGGPVGNGLIKGKKLQDMASSVQGLPSVDEKTESKKPGSKISGNEDEQSQNENKKSGSENENSLSESKKPGSENENSLSENKKPGNENENFLNENKSGPAEYASAISILILAVGIGTVVSWGLTKLGLKFPNYVGAMIVATIIRNVAEYTGRYKVPVDAISNMSTTFLNLFLGIAMITLKLWQLASLAIPLIILLAVQTVFIFFFARFVVFHMLGHDYDAAVMTAGFCGLGLGASPTAMANMQAVCRQYRYSVKAFLIVPIVGGIILDFMNSILITFFINIVS